MPVFKKRLNQLNAPNQRRTASIILWLFVLITVLAVFVPLYPHMSGADLDGSWEFGMNQAVAQGLVFGSDVIFTFGPYASIYTRSYHPATDGLMLVGGAYLAVSYWFSMVLLMRGARPHWMLIHGFILVALLYLRDVLFFSLPLLVGLLVFRLVFSENGKRLEDKLTLFALVLILSAFGLLPLIKGTMLILCGIVVILCVGLFFTLQRWRLALIFLLSPVASMLLFWVSAGQSTGALPDYFFSMAPIISGYTEAMATHGPAREIILYLLAAVWILNVIMRQTQISFGARIFLFLLYSLFLFVAFKTGFVRHDGHATIAATAILLAATLLPFAFDSRMIFSTLCVALLVWANSDINYRKTSTESMADNIAATYSMAWRGLVNRVANSQWPRLEFDGVIANLQQLAQFPILTGSTDIYSYHQTYVPASGNRWAPRPVLQSYSVYTPELAEANRNHLLGGAAPDNIIFSVEPIDGRLPSIEDGASWPILMAHYRAVQIENNFLFLRKNAGPNQVPTPLLLESAIHAIGESVPLPRSNQPIFVKIEVEPTVLGRVAGILFKPSQLQITLELRSGAIKQFRFIAGMGKSGFVLSPLIENTSEFALLYGKKELLDSKLVKSMVIAPSGAGYLLWNTKYKVIFSAISYGEPASVPNSTTIFGAPAQVPAASNSSAMKCVGFLDVVNGVSPPPASVNTQKFLEVSGWLATSADKSGLPDAVYLDLTDVTGKSTHFDTHVTPRPDVAFVFNTPELGRSGFAARADVSALQGQYTLGLAIRKAGSLKRCPQFNIPVTISR